MQAKLVGKTGDLAGKEFLISRELTIGKRGDNTIALRHKFVSRRHARIYFDAKKDCYFLEDLKSQNGTNLDGEQIHNRERLANIHIITIGNKFDFFFVVTGMYEELDFNGGVKKIKNIDGVLTAFTVALSDLKK